MSRPRPTDSAAVRWLTDRGVWQPGRSYADNLERCAKFRAKLGRIGAPPGKQWAQDLMARYKAGERMPAQFVRLAMAALGLPEQPLVMPPEHPVPRPDNKERAAGDVEVAF